jgi:quercetin dioxygenase-like cupin family protein
MSPIRSARVVLGCPTLDPTLAFFVALGFRVDAITPADAPRVAVLSGHGARLELRAGSGLAPGVVVLEVDDPAAFPSQVAPNGTSIEVVARDPGVVIPPLVPEVVVSRAAEAEWGVGRAGMRYRDLVPGRLGGVVVASHIHIPDAGPVPDYVHFHKVAFQLIFCRSGWVRVVYEDQGPPFVLQAGDCVLQPPTIRHRVLECSDDLEVIEVGCPAEHQTLADPGLELPTGELHPHRRYGGQRFVRSQRSQRQYAPWSQAGYDAADLGLGAATDGLLTGHVVRCGGGSATDAEPAHLAVAFVLTGQVTIEGSALDAGDSIAVPGSVVLGPASDDLELLVVQSRV